MVTWGKINFIFKTTEELFIHVDDKRNYWGIIHTCIKLEFLGEVIKWIDFFLHKYVTTVNKESQYLNL